MKLSSSILKRSVAVALVALVGLVATGCDSGQARIASVNGNAVSSTRFLASVKQLAAIQGTPIDDNATVLPTKTVSQYAEYLIQGEVIQQMVDKRGLKVTAATTSAVRASLMGKQGPAGFSKTPKWFQDAFIAPQAAYQTLIEDIAKGIDKSAEAKRDEAQAKKIYDSNPAQFAQACVSVIGTAEESTATSARAQITDKASFATVAKAVGTPQAPASGDKQDGDIGCIATSQLSSALLPADAAKFEAAPDGAVLGPYPMAGGGFLIIMKHSEKQQTFAEAKASIVAQIAQQGPPGAAQAQAAVTAALKAAKIEVNPKFGTWDRAKGVIVPPTGAERPSTGKSSLTSLPGMSSTPAG